MIKIIVITVLVLLAGVLVLASAKPDTFRVERSQRIEAPPEKVAALITDFHQWGAWSPWEKLEPAMQRTYSGAGSGVGATYAWSGDGKAGAGSMRIAQATDRNIAINLDFTKPFESHNVVGFALQPQGGATNVTWSMHGPSPFVSKIMQVFFSMDRMIGKDFETGLANLKVAAER